MTTSQPFIPLEQVGELLSGLFGAAQSSDASGEPRLDPLRRALDLDDLRFLRFQQEDGESPAATEDSGEFHIPCSWGGHTQGVLVVRTRAGKALPRAARQVLELAAERIALEDRNRALEQSVAESALEAEAIEAISREMTWGSNIETLVDVVLRQAVHISHAAGGALYLFEEDGADLVLQASWPPGRAWARQRIPVGSGIVGWVAENATSLRALDQGLEDQVPAAPGSKNQLAVPLISQGSVTGVLSLESAGREPFTETHERVLTVFAAQASKAIAAARLIRDLRAERDLRENILSGSPNGVVALDDRHRVVLMNNSARALLADGATAQGLQDETIDQYLPQPPFLEVLERVRLGAAEAETLVLQHGSGSHQRHLRVTVFGLRRGEGRGATLVIQDMTEQRRLDEQVMRMGRVASLGRVAAGIAHEIRNPLTGISVTLDILREEPGLSDDGQEMITDISREIDRLEALIRGVLDFARPQPAQRRTMRLAKALEWHRTFREQCRKKGLVCNLELDANPKLQGDPERLKQLFLNLAINALDATEPGGSVTLRSCADDSPDEPLRAWVEISDTGSGMDEQTVQQVFDPFFTTKNEGTGLGLSIAHSIAEQHGGSIQVSSSPGDGTTFRVELPLHPEEPES